MGDTWAGQLPPADAYSRVSRNLSEVTAEFREFIEAVPARLEAEFECVVRPATVSERDRLTEARRGPLTATALAIEPSSSDCATLLLSTDLFEGGTMLVLAFGHAVSTLLPICFCDACDEDSESLIEQTNRYVDVATLGCREFRQPHVPRHGDLLHDGPWLEHGFETSDGGGERSASADIRGETFSHTWAAWPRRRTPSRQ